MKNVHLMTETNLRQGIVFQEEPAMFTDQWRSAFAFSCWTAKNTKECHFRNCCTVCKNIRFQVKLVLANTVQYVHLHTDHTKNILPQTLQCILQQWQVQTWYLKIHLVRVATPPSKLTLTLEQTQGRLGTVLLCNDMAYHVATLMLHSNGVVNSASCRCNTDNQFRAQQKWKLYLWGTCTSVLLAWSYVELAQSSINSQTGHTKFWPRLPVG